MFDGAGNFFVDWIIKFANKLPNSNIDTQQLASDVQHIMAKVNYFVPFYLVAPYFNAWMAALFASVGIFLFVKFFQKFFRP